MKRILSILVLASILLCSFAACTRYKLTEDFVIGEWECIESTLYHGENVTNKRYLFLSADGAASYLSIDIYGYNELYGTWKIENKELVASFITGRDSPDGKLKEIDDKLTFTRDGYYLDWVGYKFSKND